MSDLVVLSIVAFSIRYFCQPPDAYKADFLVHAFGLLGPVLGIVKPSLATPVLGTMFFYHVADLFRQAFPYPLISPAA
jgi:hypothetical protein